MSWDAQGWLCFAPEPEIDHWVESVAPIAKEIASDQAMQAKWLRHGATWFVGVDCLPNDKSGRVGMGPPLGGAAHRFAQSLVGELDLHPAQISITNPGYPRKDPEESEAAHSYRRARDGAHLDGLLPEGPKKRRFLREPHAWILGIALNSATPDAAPLVVWEGSHRLMRAAFERAFSGQDPHHWPEIDVTELYQQTRREIFETCERRELSLKRGESVLLHRHLLHGVAPWADTAQSDPWGRAIAYFRPCFGDMSAWLASG